VGEEIWREGEEGGLDVDLLWMEGDGMRWMTAESGSRVGFLFTVDYHYGIFGTVPPWDFFLFLVHVLFSLPLSLSPSLRLIYDVPVHPSDCLAKQSHAPMNERKKEPKKSRFAEGRTRGREMKRRREEGRWKEGRKEGV
jgi:hypothetical protein